MIAPEHLSLLGYTDDLTRVDRPTCAFVSGAVGLFSARLAPPFSRISLNSSAHEIHVLNSFAFRCDERARLLGAFGQRSEITCNSARPLPDIAVIWNLNKCNAMDLFSKFVSPSQHTYHTRIRIGDRNSLGVIQPKASTFVSVLTLLESQDYSFRVQS